jgi:hypothetical protein
MISGLVVASRFEKAHVLQIDRPPRGSFGANQICT